MRAPRRYRLPGSGGATGIVTAACVLLLVLSCAALAQSSHDLLPDALRTISGHASREAGLRFIGNGGQWDPLARFRADLGAMRVWFTDGGVVYDLHDAGRRHALRQRFVGADNAAPRGESPDGARRTYMLGGGGPIRAGSFGEVRYESLYRGISLRYFEQQGRLKYDVIVDPEGDPSSVRFRYDGATPEIGADGALRLRTELGSVVEAEPYSYQVIGGKRREVPTRFVADGDAIGFSLGCYDHRFPLVIDPTLFYSSYLGGTQLDSARGIAVDDSGYIYVAGITRSEKFPAVNVPIGPVGTSNDIFIAKFDPTGSTLIFGAVIGGQLNDDPAGISVSGTGIVTVAGTTESSTFPVTPGAFDRTFEGTTDGFVLSLTRDGTRLRYATFLGGGGDDHITAFTVDRGDSVLVTGWTSSSDFPIAGTPWMANKNAGEDAFVCKLSAVGDRLIYSTYLGGDGNDCGTAIVTEPGGAAYVAGWTTSGNFPISSNPYASVLRGGRDCFVTKIRYTGDVLDYSTLIGGSGDDQPTSIAIDSSGAPYITGFTHSNNYPTTIVSDPGGSSWFVTKFTWPPNGTMAYSRFFAGNDHGWGATIQVSRSGDAYLAGPTDAPLFPNTSDRSRSSFDIAFVHLASDGSILGTSVIGGSGNDIPWYTSTLDRFGNFSIAGVTTSTDLPLRRGAYDSLYDASGEPGRPSDGFFMRYAFARRPAVYGPFRIAMPTVRCDTVGYVSFWLYNLGDTDLLIGPRVFRFGESRFTVDSIVPPLPTTEGDPFRIPPGDSIRFVIRYASTKVGADSNFLSIFTNDSSAGKNPFVVMITAQHFPPVLVAKPTAVDLDHVLLCSQQSGPRLIAVTLTNAGLDSTSVTGRTLSDGTSGFAISSFTGGAIPKGESGLVTLAFTPTRSGVIRDTLVIRYGACDDSIAIPLTVVVDSASIAAGAPLTIEIPSCIGALDTAVTVINGGTVPVTIDSARLSGTGLSLGGSVRQTIPTGGTGTIRIHVPDSGEGSVAGTLQIYGSPCALRLDVPISIVRRPPDTLHASPSTLDFGAVARCDGGVIAKDLPVSVTNANGVALVLDAPIISSPFSLVDLSSIPSVLGAGATFVATVRFSPSGLGAYAGTLLIPYHAGPCVDTLRIPLDGSQEAAALVTGTGTIDFGQIGVCDTSRAAVIVVENRSDVEITIDSVAGVPGVEHRAPVLSHVIAPRSHDTLYVRFKPTQAGSTDGFLTYYFSPCNDSLRIQIHGEKLGAVFSLGVRQIDFPPLLACDPASRADTVAILTGNGSSAFTAEIRSVAVTGDAAFDADRSIVGRTLKPGDTIPVPIHFTPSAVGTYEGTLTVVLGPCDDTLRLPLRGAVVTPVLAVEGGAFPPVVVGTSVIGSVILRNTTPVPLALNDLASLTSPFMLLNAKPPIPYLLQPGDSVELTLEFAPTVPGNYTLTPKAQVVAPCAFDVVVPLSATGLPASADSLGFCLIGSGSALVGDTVTMEIDGGAERTLSSPIDIEYRIGYSASQMLFLDAQSVAGATAMDDPSGLVVVTQRGVTAIVRPQILIRFRLLAGPASYVSARLDSVIVGPQARPVVLCRDSALYAVSDRCIIAGMRLGKYANLLEPSRPNPAAGTVEITFQQLEDARTVLSIYDMEGREVLRALDQNLPGGRYTVRVDVGDLSSGTYLYGIRAGGYSQARLMSVEH